MNICESYAFVHMCSISKIKILKNVMSILEFARDCQNILQVLVLCSLLMVLGFHHFFVNPVEENCFFVLLYIYFMNSKVEYL